MEKLNKILTYLESIIDTDHLDHVEHVLQNVIDYQPQDTIPLRVSYPCPEWAPYPYPETVNDMAKMMYNELVAALPSIEAKDYGIPMIRANYGVGTFASLFGLKSRILSTNLPWVDHLENDDEVRRLIEKGIPSLENGFGKQVALTHEFYREQLAKYPKCSKYIHIYHPDLQGPFDDAHLIYGPEIYTALYDDDELISELLTLITDTYIKFMEWIKPQITDGANGNCYHWGTIYGGNIVLRDDSPVNLSSDMYQEFAKKYDDRLLAHFKTGSMHFCGRADQWIFDMIESKNLRALNFGHMEKLVFGMEYLEFLKPALQKHHMPIVGYTLLQKEMDSFDFHKFNCGINYAVAFASKHDAMEALQKYCK